MRYAVVIEKAGRGYSGYVPDLPGCVAAGASVASVKAALAEVIPFHLEGLRAGGATVPGAESVVEWVEV
jgi:predicted RNase H-like HicB family nuclease